MQGHEKTSPGTRRESESREPVVGYSGLLENRPVVVPCGGRRDVHCSSLAVRPLAFTESQRGHEGGETSR